MNQSLGRKVANQIILEAQFAFNPGITMPNAAQKTVETAAALVPDRSHRSLKQMRRQSFRGSRVPRL